MERKIYIDNVEILPEELTTDIKTIILNKLRKYEKRCYNNTFINKIVDLLEYSTPVMQRNIFNGHFMVCVKFEAEFKTFLVNELIVLTVNKLEQNKVICITDEYNTTTNITKDFKPNVKDVFIGIIKKVIYDTKEKVGFFVQPFKPPNNIEASIIAGSIGEMLCGFDDCIKEFNKLKPSKEILKHFTLNAKNPLDKFSILKKHNISDKKIPTIKDESFFIVNNDCLLTGDYYICPLIDEKTMKKFGNYRVNIEPINFEDKLFQYAAGAFNYLKCVCDMEKMLKISGSKNTEIWKYLN